jgi:hypothetical protein
VKNTIDWSLPSYLRRAKPANARSAARGYRCDVCGDLIVAGELYMRGPRDCAFAHARCAQEGPSHAPSGRDPRLNPRPGDVVNDDPPAPPLFVIEVGPVGIVARRRNGPTIPWTLGEWRREMADAEVLFVEPKPATVAVAAK